MRKIFFDNGIMQKGKPIRLGSLMLDNYVSPLDATVVDKIKASDCFDIDNENCRCDSGGMTDSINAVLVGDADVALCNDYSGALSLEAAENGLCYIHPTYGTVSRYGLVQMAPSMDQIGIVCKTPKDGFDVLDIIRGYDDKDGSMYAVEEFEFHKKNDQGACNAEIKIGDADLEYSDVFPQVMRILSSAEISASISRYDGIKFGHRSKSYQNLKELYKNSRTEMLDVDLKLTAIIGTMVLAQENYAKYYDKAMRLRRLIRELPKFNDFDVLRIPNKDVLVSRLCGLPSLTVAGNTYMTGILCDDVLKTVGDGLK